MKLEKTVIGSQPLQNREYSELYTPARNNPKNDVENGKIKGPLNEEIINTDEVETVISKLNEFIEPVRTNLKFELHEKLKEYYVTVVNPVTDEVIKEIPPKKLLDMYAAMAEFMGFLVDEKI